MFAASEDTRRTQSTFYHRSRFRFSFRIAILNWFFFVFNMYLTRQMQPMKKLATVVIFIFLALDIFLRFLNCLYQSEGKCWYVCFCFLNDFAHGNKLTFVIKMNISWFCDRIQEQNTTACEEKRSKTKNHFLINYFIFVWVNNFPFFAVSQTVLVWCWKKSR